MSAHRDLSKGKAKTDVKGVLADLVSFGPSPSIREADSKDPNQRLKKLLKKLEEISRRIDHFASNL